MLFENREHAARLLAERLGPYRGRNPLIIAVPRGAVPMGKIIADALDGELDVVLVHKIGAPDNPEFAIGSVSETGYVHVSAYAHELGIGDAYVEREARAQLEVLNRRRRMYTPVRPPIDPAGRIAIVVDNGIATGLTMVAALRAVRSRKPERLIAAVAVAPPEAVERIAETADEVVCLETPPYFGAVSQFFEDFSQVSDEEVVEVLRESARVTDSRRRGP